MRLKGGLILKINNHMRNKIRNKLNNKNNKSLSHLESELLKINTGKANPNVIENLMVDYYGTPTPLSQISNIGNLNAQTLTVQPWEKNLLSECSKSIMGSDLNLNPQDNGEMLIINFPPLTEERRKDMVKLVKKEGERTKISIRNNRQESNKMVKSSDEPDNTKVSVRKTIQSITDKYTEKVDYLVSEKEKSLMNI